MKLYKWNEIEQEPISKLLTRRYINGEHITLARFFLKKGCCVPAHSHENEQMTTVLSGEMKFVVDGEQIRLKAGETLLISPFSEHDVEALEDTEALDIFSPVRTDWIEGQDNYFRGDGSR